MVARRSARQGSTIARCASWHFLVVNCSLLITSPIKNGTTGAIKGVRQFVHLQNVLYSKIFIVILAMIRMSLSSHCDIIGESRKEIVYPRIWARWTAAWLPGACAQHRASNQSGCQISAFDATIVGALTHVREQIRLQAST